MAPPPRLNKPTVVEVPIAELQRAVDLTNAIAAAAVKLFKAPYCRGKELMDEEERADWQTLRDALVEAGYEIGEELT